MNLSSDFKIRCCSLGLLLCGLVLVSMIGNDTNSMSEFKAADEIIGELHSDTRLDVDSRDVKGLFATRYNLKKVDGSIELSRVDGAISGEMCFKSMIYYTKVADDNITLSSLIKPLKKFCSGNEDATSITLHLLDLNKVK